MGEAAATSVLEPLKARMAAASWSGATLTAAPARAQIGVRARGDAVALVEETLGIPRLPEPNRVLPARTGECFWLGPAEWLWVGNPEDRGVLLEALEAAIGEADGAAVDLSSSRVIVDLKGASAREVLSSCCALDLHPHVFAPGQCAQTLVAKAPVLLTQLDRAPTYRVFVRPSFGAYVISWLTDGMEGVRAEVPE
jgi:sarcosine oxidase, subunit gamma